MQDASQTAEKVPARKRGQRRGPEEGNILWKLYCQLGSVRMSEFLALLANNHISRVTFNSQTAATFKISRMRASSLQLYRDFFRESGVDLNDHVAAELAPAPAPAPTTEQEG